MQKNIKKTKFQMLIFIKNGHHYLRVHYTKI